MRVPYRELGWVGRARRFPTQQPPQRRLSARLEERLVTHPTAPRRPLAVALRQGLQPSPVRLRQTPPRDGRPAFRSVEKLNIHPYGPVPGDGEQPDVAAVRQAERQTGRLLNGRLAVRRIGEPKRLRRCAKIRPQNPPQVRPSALKTAHRFGPRQPLRPAAFFRAEQGDVGGRRVSLQRQPPEMDGVRRQPPAFCRRSCRLRRSLV